MTIPIKMRTPNKIEKIKDSLIKDHPKMFNTTTAMEVPLWTVDDVLSWVRRAGFTAFADAFKESGVDGDLLLQLDEGNLKLDLGIDNGILRKRLTRELTNLKRNADYSCVDRHGVSQFLASIDQKSYSYGLILQDMSPDFMRKLNAGDLTDMLKEAGVTSAVHRHQIIEACLEDPNKTSTLDDQEVLDENNNNMSFDVYISHAGLNHGSNELASLLAVHLQLRGLSVFNPSQRMDMSQRICDTESCVLAANAQALKKCRNFVLVLGAGALDGSIGESQGRDKLHREVKAALQAKDCNIIPVTEADFQFPDPEELPEDIRALCYFNSVRWVHDYQDACVDKLERFLRGEAFLRAPNVGNGNRTPNLSIPFSSQTSRSRTDSGRSSPARLTPIKTGYNRQRNDSYDSAISP